MSEYDSDKNTSDSGILPEKLKPTVFGAGGKPSVPKNGDAKPTVIAGTPAKPGGGDAKGKAPTVMSGTPPSVKTDIRTPAQPQPKSEPSKGVTQSVMPGTMRKGLEVDISTMSARFPATKRDILAAARVHVQGVVVETLTTIQCAAWGTVVQSEYAKLVNESLALTGDKVITESARHLSRIYVLLGELTESFTDKGPGILFWKRRDAPWERLDDIRPELNQLRGLLDAALRRLEKIQGGLMEITEKGRVMTEKVDALSIAGQYLADLLADDTAKGNALLARSMSLTQTIAHLAESEQLRQTTIDSVAALIIKVREVILVMLPSWMEKVALMALKPSVTDTDLYEARQGVGDILNKLK